MCGGGGAAAGGGGVQRTLIGLLVFCSSLTAVGRPTFCTSANMLTAICVRGEIESSSVPRLRGANCRFRTPSRIFSRLEASTTLSA